MLTEMVTISHGGKQVVKVGMEISNVERTDDDRRVRLEDKKGVATGAVGNPVRAGDTESGNAITAIRHF